MLDRYLKDEAAVQRMRAWPVGSHLAAFAAVLSALGYALRATRSVIGYGRSQRWADG